MNRTLNRTPHRYPDDTGLRPLLQLHHPSSASNPSPMLLWSNIVAVMLLTIVPFFFLPGPAAAAERAMRRPVRDMPDLRRLVSQADLLYDKQVIRSEAGLPVGNGRTGSLLWTSPAALHLQINRTDVFAVNSQCDQTADYFGGCARVTLTFGNDVFPADNTRQHLSVYDGVATIRGKDITVEVIVWPHEDVLAIRVRRTSDSNVPIHLELSSLRPLRAETGPHTATTVVSAKDGTPLLTQTFNEGTYYCHSAVAANADGNKVSVDRPNSTTVRLSAVPDDEACIFWIGSAASFGPSRGVADKAVRRIGIAREKGYELARQQTRDWWNDFWSKSFVDLGSDDRVADILEVSNTYYLYIMAATSRGRLPAKFNGMLWCTGGDERKWGSNYWWWNTQTLYFAPMVANHIELMDPLFDMYTGMYKAAARAARQQWGAEGIYISETIPFDGAERLSDEIATELREFLLNQKPWEETSTRFRDVAARRNGFSSRWNFMHTPETRPYSWVSHILSSQAQIAWHYWQRYQFTQDESWLRERAYPMLKGVAQFYRTFPGVRQDADGIYHIYGVNNHESIWGAQDTFMELTAMKGILPVAIKASEILGVDEPLRAGWRDLLDNLTPLPTSNHPDSLLAADGNDTITWVGGLGPAARSRNGSTGSQALTHFDLVTLETPESEFTRLARASYRRFRWRPRIEANGRKRIVRILNTAGISAATIGDIEGLKRALPRQALRRDVHPSMILANRMSLEEGPQTQTIEHHGLVAHALQLALCQSKAPSPDGEPVISVFPTWPPEWDAHFSLLCKGGFLVHSAMTNGKIEFVEITSQLGGPCRVRNPWTGGDVRIVRGGGQQDVSTLKRMQFDTKGGERIVLLPTAPDPDRDRN